MGEEEGTSPEATARLEEPLLTADVRLVKRAGMDRVLAEAKLGSGGYVEDITATSLGGLVGAEILAIAAARRNFHRGFLLWRTNSLHLPLNHYLCYSVRAPADRSPD